MPEQYLRSLIGWNLQNCLWRCLDNNDSLVFELVNTTQVIIDHVCTLFILLHVPIRDVCKVEHGIQLLLFLQERSQLLPMSLGLCSVRLFASIALASAVKKVETRPVSAYMIKIIFSHWTNQPSKGIQILWQFLSADIHVNSCMTRPLVTSHSKIQSSRPHSLRKEKQESSTSVADLKRIYRESINQSSSSHDGSNTNSKSSLLEQTVMVKSSSIPPLDIIFGLLLY